MQQKKPIEKLTAKKSTATIEFLIESVEYPYSQRGESPIATAIHGTQN
jgi:hypothetical protein